MITFNAILKNEGVVPRHLARLRILRSVVLQRAPRHEQNSLDTATTQLLIALGGS